MQLNLFVNRNCFTNTPGCWIPSRILTRNQRPNRSIPVVPLVPFCNHLIPMLTRFRKIRRWQSPTMDCLTQCWIQIRVRFTIFSYNKNNKRHLQDFKTTTEMKATLTYYPTIKQTWLSMVIACFTVSRKTTIPRVMVIICFKYSQLNALNSNTFPVMSRLPLLKKESLINSAKQDWKYLTVSLLLLFSSYQSIERDEEWLASEFEFKWTISFPPRLSAQRRYSNYSSTV